METAALWEAMLGFLGLSRAEITLVLVLILCLFAANRIPPFISGLTQGIKRFHGACHETGHGLGKSLGAGLGKPVADALTHSNHTLEFQDPPALRLRQINSQMKNQFILRIAQGFGVGGIPFAPGTFGSLVGLLWFVILLWPGKFWFYLGG